MSAAFRSSRSIQPWVLPTLILSIGLLIRTLVVYYTNDTVQSSYSSLAKVHLNFDWLTNHLKDEVNQWHRGEYIFSKVYRRSNIKVDLAELYRGCPKTQ